MDSLLTMFAAGACPDKDFLGLIPWYHYLKLSSSCDVTNFTLLGKNSDLLLVLLAVVDDLLRIAGLVAVGFVIYAGIKYISSQGSPDETAKAQSTLVNALIGLAIAVVAVAVVSYLGSHLANGTAAKSAAGGVDVSSLPTAAGAANGDFIKTVLSIVFAVVGALSLLFITIGGMRYVLSRGDSQAISKAKGTIIYALIGLLIAVIAQAIVVFVLNGS